MARQQDRVNKIDIFIVEGIYLGIQYRPLHPQMFLSPVTIREPKKKNCRDPIFFWPPIYILGSEKIQSYTRNLINRSFDWRFYTEKVQFKLKIFHKTYIRSYITTYSWCRLMALDVKYPRMVGFIKECPVSMFSRLTIKRPIEWDIDKFKLKFWKISKTEI